MQESPLFPPAESFGDNLSEPLRDSNMEKSGSKQDIPKCWISLVDYKKFTHMLENHW